MNNLFLTTQYIIRKEDIYPFFSEIRARNYPCLFSCNIILNLVNNKVLNKKE